MLSLAPRSTNRGTRQAIRILIHTSTCARPRILLNGVGGPRSSFAWSAASSAYVTETALPTPEPAIEIGYRTDNVRSVMLESSAERVKVQTWFSDLPLPKPVQRPAMRTAHCSSLRIAGQTGLSSLARAPDDRPWSIR
jgi:hypothetical protein